jgi:hypothetical protein
MADGLSGLISLAYGRERVGELSSRISDEDLGEMPRQSGERLSNKTSQTLHTFSLLTFRFELYWQHRCVWKRVESV